MMQIDNMVLFASVVSHGGFTRASHALGLPVSTVSRRIGDLERKLATRLLERTTRSLKLTEAGRVYYEYCKALHLRVEEADRALQRLQHDPSGKVRIGVPFGVDSSIISAMILNFMDEYKSISIEIIIMPEPEEYHLDDLDLKFTFGQRPITQHRTALLGKADIRLHASPRYISVHGNPGRPDQLGQHQMIRYMPISVETYAPEPLQVSEHAYRVSTNDVITARTACLNGLGIAWLPSLVCAHAVSTGDLLLIMPQLRFELSIWLTTRTINDSTVKSTILTEYFLNFFKTDDVWRALEGHV